LLFLQTRYYCRMNMLMQHTLLHSSTHAKVKACFELIALLANKILLPYEYAHKAHPSSRRLRSHAGGARS
jgi:hypothetical protein